MSGSRDGGGVGPEELQYPFYDRNGVLLAIADLASPSRGVLGEADREVGP